MTPLPDPPIGAHVKVSGGLAKGGLAYAARVGAAAVQVFVSNPRGWAPAPGNAAQDALFRAGCEANGIAAYVHAPYLVNLASPTAATVERSTEAVRHSLLRGAAIGARGVVVHTGSTVAATARDAALRQVRERLLPLLDELDTVPGAPALLLEPTAGQGQSLCALVGDLAPYLGALDHHPRVGVCLDTCHAFAAGHDLPAVDEQGVSGMTRMLDELVATVGPGRLQLVHANDCKDVVGSFKDRHENIGRGHIGEAPFRDLLRHDATRGVPVILETPGEEADTAADIATLTRLRDGG